MTAQAFSQSEWKRILSRGDDPSNISQSRLNESLVRGIPDDLREDIWVYLARVGEIRKQYPPGFYYSLAQQCDQGDVDYILRDVPRTMPTHPLFRDSDGLGQARLRVLLESYAAFDQNVRYCQGMNFIAAVLLLYLSQEEAAFWVFVQIMNGPNSWKKVYYPDTPKLRSILTSINQQVEKRFPDVFDHCRREGIEPSQPFAQFVISLFCTDCPLEMSVRVIDLFLHEGDHVIFVLILRIVQAKRVVICNLKGEVSTTQDLYTYMRKTLATECFNELGLEFLTTALLLTR